MPNLNREPKKSCIIKDFCLQFKLSDDVLCDIMKRLEKAIQQGLSKATNESATVKCYPSYVRDLPTGKESGKFLSLDIGGAVFRICLVELKPDEKPKKDIRTYSIPNEKVSGESDEFFDYIADTVRVFITSLDLGTEEYWMCLSFAFPFSNSRLDSGILTTWTKQFNVKGVVGKDVVALLQQALDKKNLNVKVKAIVNDAVGCLLSCALDHPNALIGAIVGIGINACYMEKIENIELIDDKSKPYMAINTEWGNFGADGVLNDVLTEVDRDMDANTLRPGTQTFEKMTSGLYICELVRVSMIKCAEKGYLFKGEIPDSMRMKSVISSDQLNIIAKDKGDMLKATRVLEELGFSTPSTVDCINVRHIVHSLCKRSADLISAGIATLINRMSVTPLTVGIDGCMYKFYPNYKTMLTEKVRCMVNPQITFDIQLSEDGSGRGAAMVVASIKATSDG